MPANNECTDFEFNIGDTVFNRLPRTATEVAQKRATVQQGVIVGKRVSTVPMNPVNPPAIPTEPFKTIVQYDVRFSNGTTQPIVEEDLMTGTEAISSLIA